ncbi:MAG: STAS domain-containing protein [Gemmataceae bacterium]|nr:STAS domain-containing protein [Gemmataceae bacterium]
MEASFRHIACKPQHAVLVVELTDVQVPGGDAVEDLRQELLEAVGRFPQKKWVLDFSNISFFTSAGLRPLLSLHRQLTSKNGRVVFCNVKKELLDIFLVTRLVSTTPNPTTPFELADNVSDAVRRLQNFTQTKTGAVLIITFQRESLHGEELAEELAGELEHVWAEYAPEGVVLDLRHVKIVSTPCMRPILQLRTKAKESGTPIVFSNLSPEVREVFSITRLIAPSPGNPGLFEAYADNAAALAALQKP